MERAVELSLENVRSGRGGPFAAVIVERDSIVAEGANQVTAVNDPTAHAEVVAIRAAAAALQRFDLSGCDIYTTCEPCPMCLGAIYWARLDRIYFANTKRDAAEIGFDDSLIYDEIALPYNQRKIPMIPLLREQALAAFRAWRSKADKVPY